MRYILGISAWYHDSAAALVKDGEIIAAAQQERFSRRKHDSEFPREAVKFVLERSGIGPADLLAVAYYEKPLLKFERILECSHELGLAGWRQFMAAMPLWLGQRLFIKKQLRRELSELADLMKLAKAPLPRLLFPEHHLSHAAAAFYPSPFKRAAILTLDGVGEWATTTLGLGEGSNITTLQELHYPHSPGLLYSAFTYYLGFKVNGGEYKLMGLAPYGNRSGKRVADFQRLILNQLVDLRSDGSFLLNQEYFNYLTGFTMTRDRKWQQLFGLTRRRPETEITNQHCDLALAIQLVIEEIVLKLAATAKQLTDGAKYLVMSGGVALNCVVNGRLLREGLFDDIWIQPAAGDAGGALGAALAAHYIAADPEFSGRSSMKSALLGPEYSDSETVAALDSVGACYHYFDDFSDLAERVATALSDGKIVGWFQGRMEFGPRALGNRSILADPRRDDIQRILNLKIKFREGFRPFAPAVLAEYADKYFEIDRPSPYMLLTAPLAAARRCPLPQNYSDLGIYEQLYYRRSDLPAVTHVDFSARLQTVAADDNPRFHQLISAFKQLTNCPLVVNTSFNVRGEPIVQSPLEAFRCFMATEMDLLAIGNCLIKKEEQRK